MNDLIENKRIKMPNLLLLAGNGQNVGKTFLACKIIQFLSAKTEIIGLKISPHFHSINEKDLLFKNEEFTIIDEKQINSKDSSLFLQAGAKKVFFVMSKQENLKDAFAYLLPFLKNKIVICESGGLHELVIPGIFLFVKKSKEAVAKSHLLKYNPIIASNDGSNFDFNVQNIDIQNNEFILN